MELKASKCECGKVSLPATGRCPICGSNMGPVEIGNTGVVITSTVIRVAPEGFEVPRAVGFVELDCGARVVCEFPGAGKDTIIEIGDRVQVGLEDGILKASVRK